MREENFFGSTPTNNSCIGPRAIAAGSGAVAVGVAVVAATSGVVAGAVEIAGGDTIGVGVAGAGVDAISGLVVITESGVGLVDSGSAVLMVADSDFASG